MRGIKLFENYDLLGATKYYSEFLITLLFVDILSQDYQGSLLWYKKKIKKITTWFVWISHYLPDLFVY